MTQQCEAAVLVCQAYQEGWNDGFVAGQREGAAVALQTDTVYVYRRVPSGDPFGLVLLGLIIGVLLAVFSAWLAE